MFKFKEIPTIEDNTYFIFKENKILLTKDISNGKIIFDKVKTKNILKELYDNYIAFNLTLEQINFYFKNKYLPEMDKFILRLKNDCLNKQLNELVENKSKVLTIQNNKIIARKYREQLMSNKPSDLGWLRYFEVGGKEYFLFLTYNINYNNFSNYERLQIYSREGVIHNFEKEFLNPKFEEQLNKRISKNKFFEMSTDYINKINKRIENVTILQNDLKKYFNVDISEQIFKSEAFEYTNDLEKMFSTFSDFYNIHHLLSLSIDRKKYNPSKYILDKHGLYMNGFTKNDVIDCRNYSVNVNDLNQPINVPSEFVENNPFFKDILQDFKL